MTEENPQGDPAPQDPPADQPLGEGGIKALNAEREARTKAETAAKELQKQLDSVTQQLTAARNDGLPEWQQKLNDLQAKLDGAISAQQQAEKDAADAKLMQLRTDRATSKGIPVVLAKKLTGLTAEEIDAEIDADFLPHLTPGGPRPNPQQGNPSQGRGGTLDAGRELFRQHNPSKT